MTSRDRNGAAPVLVNLWFHCSPSYPRLVLTAIELHLPRCSTIPAFLILPLNMMAWTKWCSLGPSALP